MSDRVAVFVGSFDDFQNGNSVPLGLLLDLQRLSALPEKSLKEIASGLHQLKKFDLNDILESIEKHVKDVSVPAIALLT